MRLHLGEPDFNDVESAAKLYNRYLADGGFTEETEHMFLKMCSNYRAVLTRAAELRRETAPPTVA